MDTESMITGLRAWLKEYDELADTRIDVDHLRGGIGSFSILADSMPETLATFMFGRQRRRTFYLSRRMQFIIF